jgi:transposase-like protein
MTTSITPFVKRTQRDYTLGFKLQVVAAVEKGDMTYKEAQTIYGIQGRSSVLTWLRKQIASQSCSVANSKFGRFLIF